MNKFWKSGDPFIWLTGGAMALSLLMIGGLIFLIMSNGLGFFWPKNVVEIELKGGGKAIGQITDREEIPQPGAPPGTPLKSRVQLKIGNRDIYGTDFRWIEEENIIRRIFPADALVLERLEWGNFYGFIKEIREGGKTVAEGAQEGWQALLPRLKEARELYRGIKKIEKDEIGNINYRIEQLRLEIQKIKLKEDTSKPGVQEKIGEIEKRIDKQQGLYREKQDELGELYEKSRQSSIVVTTADRREKVFPIFQIVRAYRPNTLSWFEKARIYSSKLWEFVADNPREANTEGGIFPAIFGTVMMVFIMSIAVVPLGVLAALYLREYAKVCLCVQ